MPDKFTYAILCFRWIQFILFYFISIGTKKNVDLIFKQTLNFSRFTERMWRWCFFSIHEHYFDARRFTLTKRLYGPHTCFIVVHLTTNGFLYSFMREVCCTLSHFSMHFGHSYDCSIEYFSNRRFPFVLTERKSNNALKCVFVSVTNAYYWNLLDFNWNLLFYLQFNTFLCILRRSKSVSIAIINLLIS